MPVIERPDMILPAMLATFASPVLTGLIMSGALAASMSSADSQLHVSSSVFTIDIYKEFINKKATDAQSLFMGKIAIVVISCIALLMSQLTRTLLVAIVTIALGGCLQIMPALIGALYWPRGTKKGAILGIIAGVLALLITQFIYKAPAGITSGVWGLIFNTITFVTVSFFTEAPNETSQNRFHKYLKEINDAYDNGIKGEYSD